MGPAVHGANLVRRFTPLEDPPRTNAAGRVTRRGADDGERLVIIRERIHDALRPLRFRGHLPHDRIAVEGDKSDKLLAIAHAVTQPR